MNFLVIESECEATEGDDHTIAHDPLQQGYIDLGNPMGPTGEARWCDESFGPSYGDGRRYEHEETYGMTKVASKRFKEQ
jgi:hypothetical protein